MHGPILRVIFTAMLATICVQTIAQGRNSPATTRANDRYQLGKVDVVGKGPIAAILIPGYTCDGSVFDAFTQSTGDAFTFYVVTLPGFGGTQAPAMPPADDAGHLWIDQAATAIHQLAVDQKLDHPMLIGHSMGGTLVYKLLAEFPDEFRSGVSIDGLPGYPVFGDRAKSSAAMARMLASQPADAFRAGQKRSIAALVTSDANAALAIQQAAKVEQTVAVEYMRQFLLCDFSNELPNIKSPLLIMAAISPDYGARSEAFRKFYTLAQSKVPGSKIVVFESTRHFIMYDRPSEFEMVIRDFAAGKNIPLQVGEPPTTQPGN